MITIQIFNEDTEQFDAPIKANAKGGLQTPVTLTDAFDETLDTAIVTILSDGHDLPNNNPYVEEWAKVRLDVDGDVRYYYNTSCKSKNETRGNETHGNPPVFRMTLELLELIFITQYISLDNLCFSNDIADDGTPITHNIASVLTRLNNQTYTMLETDKPNKVPFSFTFDANEEWAQMTAPEFFFTENTLFQALVRIGEAIGGFPELEFISNGRYKLKYRIWDSGDVEHYDVPWNKITNIEFNNTVDNCATVVDSTVKNMLNASENGENTAVYPLPGADKSNAYAPPRTESYNVEITDENCFIELPHPIERIIKLEGYCQTRSNLGSLNGTRTYKDITQYLCEYNEWITLQEGVTNLLLNPYRKSRYYYKAGKKRIENLNSSVTEILFKEENPAGATNPLPGRAAGLCMRVTYIPRLDGRVKIGRNGAKKKIDYIVNQAANVVNAGAYAKYLQGLVNRMQGQYAITTITQQRNPKDPKYTLFGKGSFLNGWRIYRAVHTISNKSVISEYYSSSEWNRRADFVDIPHKQRQWAIPADEKVTDRNINYAEEVWYSIGEELPASDGCISTGEIGATALFGFSDKSKGSRPNLAYIAWKTSRQISTDAADQSNGYALASCSPVPVDTHILMNWAAEDNASMGSRSYNAWGNSYYTERQMFVAYPPKAQYLRFKLSDKMPSVYNFNGEYTGTDAEKEKNLTFCMSFPLSTKKQYTDVENDFATISGIRLQKDLRERILFTYQLDFLGKNDTIVYAGAATWSALCNRNTTDLRVFLNSPIPYGPNSISGQGTEITVTSTSFNASRLLIEFASASWTNIAVCDKNGKLMFAKNKSDSGSNISIYGCNRKKEWKKS